MRVLEFHQRRSHAVCLGQDAQDLTGLLLAFGMTARRVGLAAKILKILVHPVQENGFETDVRLQENSRPVGVFPLDRVEACGMLVYSINFNPLIC